MIVPSRGNVPYSDEDAKARNEKTAVQAAFPLQKTNTGVLRGR